MSPTGRVITTSGIALVHVAGDRVAEDYTIVDLFGLQQLEGTPTRWSARRPVS